MDSVYESILEPASRNSLLISGLEAVKQSLIAEDKIEEQFNQAENTIGGVRQMLQACWWIVTPDKQPHLQKAIEAVKEAQELLGPAEYKHVRQNYDQFQKKISGRLNAIEKSIAEIFKTVKDDGQYPKTSLIEFLTDATAKLQNAKKTIDEITTKVTDPEDDETQRALNHSCGRLVKELVKLIPNSVAGAILNIERVGSMTEEAIGHAIRKKLGNESGPFLKIINKGVTAGLTSIDPLGRWEGRTVCLLYWERQRRGICFFISRFAG